MTPKIASKNSLIKFPIKTNSFNWKNKKNSFSIIRQCQINRNWQPIDVTAIYKSTVSCKATQFLSTFESVVVELSIRYFVTLMSELIRNIQYFFGNTYINAPLLQFTTVYLYLNTSCMHYNIAFYTFLNVLFSSISM